MSEIHPDREGGQTPEPPEDPRLEIPELLRRPVEHPSLEPKQKSTLGSSMGELGVALAIGIDFLVIVAAGGGLGWLLDRQMGWSPVGLLGGLAIGFAGGLFRMLHRLSKQDQGGGVLGMKGGGRAGIRGGGGGGPERVKGAGKAPKK